MDWLVGSSFVVGLAGLGAGVASLVAARRARSEARAAASHFEGLQEEMAALDRRLQGRIGVVAVEAKKASGGLRIAEHTTIADAMSLNRDAKAILAAFHIGGCSSCAVDDGQTLMSAAMGNGADLPTLLAALNGLAPLPAPHAH